MMIQKNQEEKYHIRTEIEKQREEQILKVKEEVQYKKEESE